MRKINGKEIAASVIDRLKLQPVPKKILAAVLVGDDPASLSFLKQKEKVAKELAIDFRLYTINDTPTNDKLRKEIGKIARLSRVGGVIVQLPLPEGVNRRYVLNTIPIEKDVDVLSEKAQEAFCRGKSKILPPAVGVVEEILNATRNIRIRPNLPNSQDSLNSDSFVDLGYAKIAIVGHGFLVGQPIASWLKDKAREVKIFDLGDNLKELKSYDLIISGVGKAGLIKPGMLKEGIGVIDFGYSLDASGKIHGDFDAILNSEFLIHNSGWYTPTPGGTGPILVAKLMENFYRLSSIL